METHVATPVRWDFVRGAPIFMVPIQTVDIERIINIAPQLRDQPSTEITPERLVKPLNQLQLPTPFHRLPVSIGFTPANPFLLTYSRLLSVLPLSAIITTRTNLPPTMLRRLRFYKEH